ncbi:hypothetical protein, partial [Bifidobacterium myosotis]|uniref:hypothetical protein n=1 Tax=Bifidobacterium myosotis TaxID=1630166 RepID=UPI001B8078E9
MFWNLSSRDTGTAFSQLLSDMFDKKSDNVSDKERAAMHQPRKGSDCVWRWGIQRSIANVPFNPNRFIPSPSVDTECGIVQVNHYPPNSTIAKAAKVTPSVTSPEIMRFLIC